MKLSLDVNSTLFSKLLQDVPEPNFIGEVSDLEDIELIQGQDMFEKPHYQKKE